MDASFLQYIYLYYTTSINNVMKESLQNSCMAMCGNSMPQCYTHRWFFGSYKWCVVYVSWISLHNDLRDFLIGHDFWKDKWLKWLVFYFQAKKRICCCRLSKDSIICHCHCQPKCKFLKLQFFRHEKIVIAVQDKILHF